MAKKKFGKFLLFSAAVGAVAAGAYYYLQNKNGVSNEESDEDDDFDDFSEDLDMDSSKSSNAGKRSYVSLDFDSADNTDKACAEKPSSETETAKEALDNLDKAAESAVAEVEDFFDEDDEDELTEE